MVLRQIQHGLIAPEAFAGRHISCVLAVIGDAHGGPGNHRAVGVRAAVGQKCLSDPKRSAGVYAAKKIQIIGKEEAPGLLAVVLDRLYIGPESILFGIELRCGVIGSADRGGGYIVAPYTDVQGVQGDWVSFRVIVFPLGI